MSLEADTRALVAAYLSTGKVCVTLVWSPSGDMEHHEPNMRTDQLLELLRDAVSNFSKANRGAATLQ